jgi:hypothetical protein
MKVWIVFYCWDYEGCDVQAVFDDEELANKFAALPKPVGVDSRKVRAFEVIDEKRLPHVKVDR